MVCVESYRISQSGHEHVPTDESGSQPFHVEVILQLLVLYHHLVVIRVVRISQIKDNGRVGLPSASVRVGCSEVNASVEVQRPIGIDVNV